MPTLPTDLRNKLERVVIDARDAAEAGARDALESLAVHHHEPYPHMKPAQRKLRNHLRARARQLGDKQDKAGRLTIDHLVHECAYEHWHRMLFARFLAENNLLIEPDENMAISLAEAEELAKDQGLDVWAYASRCAQRMLPQIFRPDDPLLQVSFATEHRIKLEKLLASLPAAVFTASDALGWVYQFWQSKKKDEVNRSEVKIGADELPAVTQLFTEPYMVEFLYHNTLGAWWAGKVLKEQGERIKAKWEACQTEEDCRRLLALPGVGWEYLRFVRIPSPSGRGQGESASRLLPQHILDNARELRKNQTDAEQLLWSILRDRRFLDLKFRRQHPIGDFILDFYCPERKLAIELDGGQHNESRRQQRDANRTQELEKQGIRVLRFWNHDVLCDLDAVLAKIWATLEEHPHPSPLPKGEGVWRPAAGTFDGWPKAARDIKVLDPCCGSGHFLVAGLHLLTAIRMAEEGLTAAQAVDAVLRDNLHGLEIDERCCQIAAFALAFEAWKMGDFTAEDAEGRGGGPRYRELPPLHIACSGIGPQCSEEQWIKLAEQSGIPIPAVGREAIRNGLLNLHRLFSQAPTLGSLINPKDLPADLIAADYETIQPYLVAIRSVEKADDETRERAIAAAGMVKAADLLAGEYTLVITNVPYLGRGKQDDRLRQWAEENEPDGKADLATMFISRTFKWLGKSGSVAVVSPQNWLFLTTYKKLRERLLRDETWNVVARVGPGAFETIGGHVVNVALLMISCGKVDGGHTMLGIDASSGTDATGKAALLRGDADTAPDDLRRLPQAAQRTNPDAMIQLRGASDVSLLARTALAYQGIATADNPAFVVAFWEVQIRSDDWVWLQSAPPDTMHFAGRQELLRSGFLTSTKHTGNLSGRQAWNRQGVAISETGRLFATRYTGERFLCNCHSLVPHSQSDLLPVWCFAESGELEREIRKANQKLAVKNGYFGKVPFDLAHWHKVAAKKYPDGLPEPESDDPTQWLFHGWPVVNLPAAGKEALQPLGEREAAIATLQVAVARLLGYRWPAELDEKMRLSQRARALVAKCEELAKFADNDGIVCIPAVRGEEPAAERLRRLLAAAYGEAWSAEREEKLIRATGSTAADLDEWLRNDFFAQHCKLFHDRPFVWHIWDGRKREGFHALVNYHKLCGAGSTAAGAEGHRDKHPEPPPRSSASSAVTSAGRRLLESLTYAYLGEWITRQRDGVKRGEGGAEDRLAAALELQKRLEAILAGEPPFDIFVRWKPLAQQPIGWEPDINDGVRVNIRPLLASDLPKGPKGAGILRCKPNIKWGKDRGKEPDRPKDEYPWFWGWDEKTMDFAGGKTFDGNRWNACHYTNKVKQSARDAAGKGKQ